MPPCRWVAGPPEIGFGERHTLLVSPSVLIAESNATSAAARYQAGHLRSQFVGVGVESGLADEEDLPRRPESLSRLNDFGDLTNCVPTSVVAKVTPNDAALLTAAFTAWETEIASLNDCCAACTRVAPLGRVNMLCNASVPGSVAAGTS